MTVYSLEVKTGPQEKQTAVHDIGIDRGSLKQAVARAQYLCDENGWWSYVLYSGKTNKPCYADHRPWSEFSPKKKKSKKLNEPTLPPEFLPTEGPKIAT